MPKWPAQPRTYVGSERRSAKVTPAGRYLVVLVEFPEVPMTTRKGDLFYILQFEVVKGDMVREKIPFFIRSDIQGLPTLEWQGEGRWRELLKAFGLDANAMAAIETPELLYRPAVMNVKQTGDRNFQKIEACTPDEQEECLEYVTRYYPLKEDAR